MDKRELSKLGRAAGRVLLALGFVFSQTAWAAQSQSTKENPAPTNKASAQQSPVKATPSTPAKAESEDAESAARQNATEGNAPRDGRHEGIKVHGHWTIEVRNPNGTLADRREFENSLIQGTGEGNYILAALLSHGLTLGSWTVQLINSSAAGLCGNIGACELVENSFSTAFSNIVVDSSNLTVSSNAGNVVLSGSVIVSSAGTINQVQSLLCTCSPTLTASACPTSSTQNIGANFTLASPSPVNVVAGQTVQVTVIFSFS